MHDPAEQLARIYQAGFEIKTFSRFPKAIGVVRDECVALFESRPDGLAMIGTAGWCIGEAIGVLVKKQGRQVFQAKDHMVEADAERLERLQRFERDLHALLEANA